MDVKRTEINETIIPNMTILSNRTCKTWVWCTSYVHMHKIIIVVNIISASTYYCRKLVSCEAKIIDPYRAKVFEILTNNVCIVAVSARSGSNASLVKSITTIAEV